MNTFGKSCSAREDSHTKKDEAKYGDNDEDTDERCGWAASTNKRVEWKKDTITPRTELGCKFNV